MKYGQQAEEGEKKNLFSPPGGKQKNLKKFPGLIREFSFPTIVENTFVSFPALHSLHIKKSEVNSDSLRGKKSAGRSFIIIFVHFSSVNK